MPNKPTLSDFFAPKNPVAQPRRIPKGVSLRNQFENEEEFKRRMEEIIAKRRHAATKTLGSNS